MTKVSQVMTENPVCCLGSDSVSSVAQQMQIHDIGAMPVVADHETKKLIGIVTDRDVALRVVAADRETKGTWVADIMTPNPVACHPNDNISLAIDAMSLNRVRRIPTIDDNGQLVGIVSQADVATRLHDTHKTADVVTEISQPSSIKLPH
jgi:CBS domain-containing protein